MIIESNDILARQRVTDSDVMKVGFVDARWKHHAKVSGYHPISEGIGPILRIKPQVPRWIGQIAGMGLRMPKFSMAADIALAMRRNKVSIVDIFDGEGYLWVASSLARFPRTKVICTFHHCPDQLADKVRELPPNCIHGAICVSRCQIPYVKPLAKQERCYFVPHGVDTEYFCPDNTICRDPNLVITVGFHRRDLRTLSAVAKLLKDRHPGAKFCLIAPSASLPRDVDLSSIEVRSGLTDAELLNVYRSAAVLLLPLEHSTANNSLLEGMACGLPMVVTDVGGVRDYASSEFAKFCLPGDVMSHAVQLEELLCNESRRVTMGQAAREAALQFSWTEVRNLLKNVIGEINSNER